MIPSQSSDEEATAYHEAGHAVVGAVLDRPPISVTIIPDSGAAGKNEFSVDFRPEFKTHLDASPEKIAYIEARILTKLAGTIAHDLRFSGRPHDAGDAYDQQCARSIIEDNAGWADSDRDAYLRQLEDAARRLLQIHWLWVEAVARALIERKTISTAEIMELRPGE